jgi:hypothetical protein
LRSSMARRSVFDPTIKPPTPHSTSA